MGFESLFMQFWRIRERIMDINEATTGKPRSSSRSMSSEAFARDLTPEQCKWILDEVDKCEKEIKSLKATLLDDYTVKKRTVGKGILTREQAYELGAAGPHPARQRHCPGHAPAQIRGL